MALNARIIVLCIGLLMISVALTPTLPVDAQGNASVEIKLFGWFAWWNFDTSKLYSKYKYFSHVSPFWFKVDDDGSVIPIKSIGDTFKNFVSFAQDKGIKVVPTVICHSSSLIKLILNNQTSRDVVEEIAKVVEDYGFDGVNIDFERVYSSDRQAFVSFLRRLKLRLKQIGDKEVSVDVFPKTRDVVTGYDYEKIAEVVDYVVIMAYDYHYPGGSPGPVAPIWWIQDIIEYALTKVPSNKLIIGIPAYGIDWPVGGTGKAVTYGSAISRAKALRVKVLYDYKEGEYHYSYTAGRRRHEVWFSGPASHLDRLKLIKKFGLKYVAVWYVGIEDSSFWNALDEVNRKNLSDIVIETYPKSCKGYERYEIKGRLEPGIPKAKIYVMYSLDNGATWILDKTVTTDNTGGFVYEFLPTKGGVYLVLFQWNGSEAYLGDYELVTIRVTLIQTKTYLTLKVNNTSPVVGSYVEISGKINPPIAGAQIDLYYSTDGSWIKISSVLADDKGEFKYVWRPQTEGKYCIKARYNGSKSYAPSEHTLTIEVQPKSSLKINLASHNISAVLGEWVKISGYVEPRMSVNLKIYFRPEYTSEWSFMCEISTNSSGEFAHLWKPYETGNYYVKVAFEGNPYWKPTYAILIVHVEEKREEMPIELILVLIIVAVAAALIVVKKLLIR